MQVTECVTVVQTRVQYPAPAICPAKEYGVALELNNSKSLHNRTTPECTRKLLQACKTVGCKIALGSDTHAIEELGRDDSILPYLQETSFPESLLVNNTADKAFAFIKERKKNKQ